MWETWVQSLGQEDSLVKEKATHSSIHAWKIPWTEKPGELQSMAWGLKESDMTATSLSLLKHHFLDPSPTYCLLFPYYSIKNVKSS